MSLINDHCATIFAICLLNFYKTEVQTVILRCLTGLHLDWFRHYGLRCGWRPCMCLANSQKKATDKWPFYDHFWPFLANCMAIFHKTEIQTVILRYLMGLNLDWFKSYGLRCRWRLRACLANFKKIATDKWTFYYHIWPFFCQLYVYLSQSWD